MDKVVLDDPGCRGGNLPERMHVRHHIMSSLLFLNRSYLKLLRIQMLLVYQSRAVLVDRTTHQILLHLVDRSV